MMDISDRFTEELYKLIPSDRILENEPMWEHTSFRVGGRARYFIKAESAGELSALISLADEEGIPRYVVGRGSNLLVSDKGYDGMILTLTGELAELRTEETLVYSGGGCNLIAASLEAAKASLTGMEFASGIPGSVGGAVFMNAGAYGGEIADIISYADILTPAGEIKRLTAPELQLSYRSSILKKEGGICLKACFKLERGDGESIQEKINELAQKRREKQPLEYPSAGSTFKRPEGYFAGKLIMDAGLSGKRLGCACVSEKHCGFIVNEKGNEGKASDIRALMELVQEEVYRQFSVRLEPEVCMIGEF